MEKQTIKLLDGATDVHITEATDIETTIMFFAPVWKDRACTYKVLGKWEIESINRNLVTLINHDEIISDKVKKDVINVLEETGLQTYELVCPFDDLEAAKVYAQKKGYYVTVNGFFIQIN